MGELKKYFQDNKPSLNEFYIQHIIQQLAPEIECVNSKYIIHLDLQ